MPLKIVHKDHVTIPGRGYVLLVAPFSTGPKVDPFIGQIVEEAALLSKSFAVISKSIREPVEPNTVHFAQSGLGESIHTFLEEDGVRCILVIRGRIDPGVVVTTAKGESASQPVIGLIKTRLARDFKTLVEADFKSLDPESIVTIYPKKDQQGTFTVEAIQIEFGPQEETLEGNKVVEAIADLVGLINRELGFSESDQGSSDALN